MILSFVAFCRRLARKLRAWIKAKLNSPVPEPPSWQALSPAARSAALTDIFDDESLLAVLSPTEIMVPDALTKEFGFSATYPGTKPGAAKAGAPK